MKKTIFSLLIMTCFAFSDNEEPKVTTYSYGHNGMEYVAKNKNGTVIISTFNSKMTIRQEIATKIYRMYLDQKLQSDQKVTVFGDEADVTGRCVIRKKDNLTAVDFYYETVSWCSGKKEIYKKNI
ncbi:hypothetical protein [Flavobacterium terrisoli]|uniref:hypothetical protein n=1 Tax=Flavobacterium terrisoli TaxID=3242195 RepID=UPI00254308C8|nr:hypothetical protein [Flavobacterium buctense]